MLSRAKIRQKKDRLQRMLLDAQETQAVARLGLWELQTMLCKHPEAKADRDMIQCNDCGLIEFNTNRRRR